MELTKRDTPSARRDARWPNVFIFPKELRDLIPDHGARALVVDEVQGVPALGIVDAEAALRIRLQFIVHETGKLQGRLPVYLDLDAATMRALGKFMIGLADQSNN